MAHSAGADAHGAGAVWLPAGGPGADGPGRGPLCRNCPGDLAAPGLAHSPPEPVPLPGKAAPGLLAHRGQLQGSGLYGAGGPVAVGRRRPGRPVAGLRLGPDPVGAGAGLYGRHGPGYLLRLRGPGKAPHPGHDLCFSLQSGHRPGLPGAAPGAGPAVALGLRGPGPGGAQQRAGGPAPGRPHLGALGGFKSTPAQASPLKGRGLCKSSC